jgi:WD40 repeat protein
VHHLIASKQVDRAVRELTSAEYIAAKFALKDGAMLMRQYADVQRALTAACVTAAADLGKCKATVGRFLKDLQRFPPLLALQMCVQEPDHHPLCIAAKSLLERASDSQPAKHGSCELRSRVVEWTNKHQELDPCQLEIKEHNGVVTSLAYVPDSGDGKNEARIVSASDDGTVKVTSVVSGEVVLELQGHSGPVKSVAVSKDGKRLVSGGDDKTVRVWDALTGKDLRVLSGHNDPVLSVCFSPCGTKIVSCGGLVKAYGGNDDFSIRIWDAETGTHIGSPLSGHKDPVRSLCFSSCGTKIVSCGGQRKVYGGNQDFSIRIWDTETGTQIGSPLTGDKGILCVNFSPNNNILAAGDFGGNIRLYDPETGEVKSTLNVDSGSVNSVAFSPDGSKIAAAHSHEIQLFDAQTQAKLGSPLSGHSNTVSSVAWNNDGSKLATGSWDATVRIWSVSSPGTCLLSPDDKQVGSGSDDEAVKIWRTQVSTGTGQSTRGHSNT